MLKLNMLLSGVLDNHPKRVVPEPALCVVTRFGMVVIKKQGVFSMRNHDKTAKRIAVTAVTAAIYVVFTVILPIPSYSFMQYRASEILNLLVFYNPIFAPGIILGCLIANMFSPYLVLDMVFGTLATVLALFFIRKTRKLHLATLPPIIFNAPIIALVILLAIGSPYSLTNYFIYMAWVALGQFAVMVLTAYPLFKMLEKKNPKFIEFIKNI